MPEPPSPPPPSSSPLNFSQTLSVTPLNNSSDDEYETLHPPERMGNAANIAYGGFALALATKAASLTVPDAYHLYSLTGHYLGPALTTRPLHAKVTRIRQTRTFATRQIQISQRQDDGSLRACLIALADFQVKEQASLLEYSAPPLRGPYSHYSALPDALTHSLSLVDAGKIPLAVQQAWATSFGVMMRMYETRPCPEGIFAQTLSGTVKGIPTTQSHLPITQKASAEWIRQLDPVESKHDRLASLAFYMDGAISFAPLVFSGLFLDDAGACSSLDFALRVFSAEVKVGEWMLKELTTDVGAEGRTYSEGRLWDERGRCVASMTQQSILRPKKGMGVVKL